MLWPNGTQSKPAKGGSYGDARSGGRIHAGTDFIGYTDLHAIAAGVVTFAGKFNDAAGYAVVIDSVIDGVTVTVCRFHVAPGTIAVRKGQHVPEGAYLGKMGRSGNATGFCDHVELRFWRNGSFTTTDPETWIAAHLGGAPAFPLAAGSYFGPKLPLSNTRSVSGYFGHRADLKRWQLRMRERGWAITADGLYGPQTQAVARAFQLEKGLTVDGLIGPATWAAAWTAPVTR